MRIGRSFGADDAVCLGALGVFVAGLCLLPIAETDVFFRLKVGQEIWARQDLLGRNLFSFTAPDHPDLDASWAFEVALSALYRLGGFTAIVVAKTVVLVGTFAAVYGVCRYQNGSHPVATASVLALAAVAMRERFVERPHIVSFAGEVVVSWVVTSWCFASEQTQQQEQQQEQQQQQGTRTRDTARTRDYGWRHVAFAGAMVTWANAHAGIFVATGVLMMTALGSWWRRDHRAACRALEFAVIAALSTFATPLGVNIVRYWMLHIRIPQIHTIDEFRAATWRSDAPYFLWTIALLLSCLLGPGFRRSLRMVSGWAWQQASRAPRDPRTPQLQGAPHAPKDLRALPLAYVLPGAAMIVLGFTSVRFSADAVIMTAPVLAAALTPRRDGAHARNRDRAGAGLAATVTAVALLSVTFIPRVLQVRSGHRFIELGLESEIVPARAIDFVQTHGLRERMYNDFELGSYLAFQGFPRYRVFVDPRLPAYPDDLHRLLGRFDLTHAEWDAAMARYGVDSALLTHAGINRRVSWWDPQTWALIYRQDDARVFVRRLPRWQQIIAKLEIPATFTFTVDDGTATVPLAERPSTSPVADCEWQRRLGDLYFETDQRPDSAGGAAAEAAYRRALSEPGCLAPAQEARLSTWLGLASLSAGALVDAEVGFSRALERFPFDVTTRAARADALEKLGRRREAIADWTRVVQETLDPLVRAKAADRLRRLRD